MSVGRAAALAAAALVAGLWLGGHPDSLPEPLRAAFVDDRIAVYTEALEAVEDNYFREIRGERLDDASIRGVISDLRRRHDDRFSHYFDPEQLEQFEEATSGRFSGVGLSVVEVKRGLRVALVFERSPAERAGMQTDDIVVEVNGRSIAGLDADLAAARIKGPPGTTVELGVLRPSSGRTRELTLERAEVKVPVAAGSLREAGERRVAYLAFASFTSGAHAELRREIERLRRRGADGLVLDLRGNGGGFLQEAILCASLFLPEDAVVVSTDSRTQGERIYRAAGGRLPVQPTVVLIDENSASAAEILAAALADHGLATVVGQRSFGKGSFQQVLELSNGGALDLTIGEYFTPEGVSLAGKGIEPDVGARDRAGTPADEAVRRALAVLGRELREQ